MQEYSYVYNGGTLMQMVIETTVDDGAPVTETLSFSYDASGMPMSVVYNGTAYFYTVNLQGDVMAIVDATGNAVVSYAYDAWGNILSVTGTMAETLGESNPPALPRLRLRSRNRPLLPPVPLLRPRRRKIHQRRHFCFHWTRHSRQ